MMSIGLVREIIEDIVCGYYTRKNHFPVKRLNFIYECSSCNRFHRGYQRESVKSGTEISFYINFAKG